MRFVVALLLASVSAIAQTPVTDAKSYVKYDQPTIVLDHVRVIDGTGAPGKPDQMLVIANGKIQSIAAAGQPPAGAQVLDLSGDSVFPGIVGMHDHMYYPAPMRNLALYPEHAWSFPRLYLAAGVTTIRTTGSVEPYTDLEIKKEIDERKMPGPKMHVTGPYLEGQGAFTPQMHQLADAEDARRTVNYWISEGVTNFKAYMNITRDELRAAAEEAHKKNLKITGHLCSIGFREAAALGIDDLEHGIIVDSEFAPSKQPDKCPPQRDIRDTLLKLDIQGEQVQSMIHDLIAHHVAMTSTLPVFEGSVPGRPPIRQANLDAMLPEARQAYLNVRDNLNKNAAQSQAPASFKKEEEFEFAFAKAGGLLLAGLDPTGNGAVVAGYGDQREIELLVEAGFTPLEALRIATYNGAQYLGLLDQIGTLSAGKQADIVVVKGDPSKTISDIENVELVFKDGIAYDPAKLVKDANGFVGLK
ncbi:MAG: amidohydrolase family protein [Acidobacteria bacterium]|nr:amidohydrolase family protein [Acidobacteriota bacterium]MBV9438023.1 amidohydrolase family protein [Acidobacteriota bacterium]